MCCMAARFSVARSGRCPLAAKATPARVAGMPLRVPRVASATSPGDGCSPDSLPGSVMFGLSTTPSKSTP